jgi:hypothetical protein
VHRHADRRALVVADALDERSERQIRAQELEAEAIKALVLVRPTGVVSSSSI